MKRSLVLMAAAGLLVSACSSGDEQSSPGAPIDTETTAPVAGAQENAVVSGAVCYGWPNGTTDAQPCAVGLKGPGGGRVFYDAGSVQPWGRFLEVAPQRWNGTLYECFGWNGGDCGVDPGIGNEKKTSDRGAPSSGDKLGNGTFMCGPGSQFTDVKEIEFAGAAGHNGSGIGDGRANTTLLLAAPECQGGLSDNGLQNAFRLASNYQGGGLDDWYLPSWDEIQQLCLYTGRNSIGGFATKTAAGNRLYYASSSTKPNTGANGRTKTVFRAVHMNPEKDGSGCSETMVLGKATNEATNGSGSYESSLAVRPVRAFS